MNDRELVAGALSEGDCLSLDSLQAMLDGRAAEPDAAHFASCARCQAESALLASFQGGARPSEVEDARWIESRLPKRWGARRWSAHPWRLGALALTCAASLVLGVGLLQRRPVDSAAIRDHGETDVFRSGAIENLAPVGDVTQKPSALTWTPVSGAADYEVTLMQVDRSVLWSAAVRTSSFTLPEELRKKLLPNKAVLWRVTARDRSGKEMASSAIQRFRLIL